MKILFFLLPLIFLFGCETDINSSQASAPFTEKKAEARQSREQSDALLKQKAVLSEKLGMMELETTHKKELEEIKMKKELANITMQKEIVLGKLDSELEMKRILLEKEKEMELLRQQNLIRESEHQLSEQRYILLFASLIVIILTGALYYFFKQRHANKLRAYNDNLEKYFQNKQNESRVKVAEKIIDTIASGNLNREQESRLIEALNGQNSRQIAAHEDTVADDADVIEHLPNKD